MRYLLPMALLLVVGTVPTPAVEGPAETMRVSVVAILASETTDHVDPRLEFIAKETQKHRPKLKGFRVGTMSSKSIALKVPESFALVENQRASITLQKMADKDNRPQLKVVPPTIGEITYSTTCGKFFPIVTSYLTSGKETLIIAIRVELSNE